MSAPTSVPTPAAAPPPPPAPTPAGKGFPSKVYNGLVKSADKFIPQNLRPLWQHPAGPKTVFFWAPAFKWGLVIAGIGDLTRPVENLSIPQCASLAATGIIWSRYSLVIIPKNYSLFSVNVFVALTQVYQLSRAYKHHMDTKAAEAAAEPKPTSKT